ncbi:VOC family protein [Paenibacillus kobensis]|uniref:VOC family protein n=1 Tax=Paenibacillus kobensis TaxID=59841 RepID=UPI000FDA8CCD|nr:VOC family protein [Paenibacillus kobensis]
MNNYAAATKTSFIHPIRNKIGGVFIHVSNMERSVNWYHRLFGMPERSAATEKVHDITMDGETGFVLDQNGYDSGLPAEQRALLMLDSPDVGAAYRFVQQSGIEIVEDIMQFPGMAFFTFRDPDGNLLMVCGNPGTEEETGTEETAAESTSQNEPVRYDAGGTVLHASGQAQAALVTSSGLELTGHAYAEGEYETPLRIETTVKINQGALYLTYGNGLAALNFGNSPEVQEHGTGDDLFVVHPKLNKHFTFHHKGSIPVGEWARVEWTIDERWMEIHVDGQLFHRQEGYFGKMNGRAGIAGVMGQVTVKSYAVESLTPEDHAVWLAVSGSASAEDRLIADAACQAAATNGGLWLSGGEEGGFARTGGVYSAPFTFAAELQSYTRSAILYGGFSAIIKWNSEGKLLFTDPQSREEVWVDEANLPYGDFAKIEWKLDQSFTSLSINGSVVLERRGNYEDCRFKLGIGAEAGSAVTVRSLSIDS